MGVQLVHDLLYLTGIEQLHIAKMVDQIHKLLFGFDFLGGQKLLDGGSENLQVVERVLLDLLHKIEYDLSLFVLSI
jgi:hypothetical protein